MTSKKALPINRSMESILKQLKLSGRMKIECYLTPFLLMNHVLDLLHFSKINFGAQSILFERSAYGLFP